VQQTKFQLKGLSKELVINYSGLAFWLWVVISKFEKNALIISKFSYVK